MTAEEKVKKCMDGLLEQYRPLGIAAVTNPTAYEQYCDLLTRVALAELRQEGIIIED